MTDLAIFTGIALTLWSIAAILTVLACTLQMAFAAFKRR